MLARNVGFIYAYNAVQCPMEAVSQRRSLLHNAVALGGMGAVGVAKGTPRATVAGSSARRHAHTSVNGASDPASPPAGMAGIPFYEYLPHQLKTVKPAALGFVVYGTIGGLLGGVRTRLCSRIMRAADTLADGRAS